MSFDVNKFLSVVNDLGGLQSPSKFSVRVFPRYQSDDATYLEFLCESVDVPDVTFSSTGVRPLGYGYARQVPLVPVYQSINLGFYDDNAKAAVGFMVDWRNRVVSSEYEPGGSSVDSGYGTPFLVSYLDSYAARVEITSFDQNGEPNRRVVAHDAWPASVGPVRYAWSAASQVSLLPVSINYSSLTTTNEVTE